MGYKAHGPNKGLANKHGMHRMYAWNDLSTPTVGLGASSWGEGELVGGS